MATRADYRNAVEDFLVGLEDEGYGDFEFTDPELNTYIGIAVARLYPHIYKRVALENQAPTSYGTSGIYGKVATTFAERVFMVEDATELTLVSGWKVRPGAIVNIDMLCYPTVNIYYTDAYSLPADDVTDAGIADVYTQLVVLGALIEALSARHDTGIRGDPPPTGTFTQTQLIDRLQPRYEKLLNDLAMTLPGLVL